jgi:hypothetical protein
MSRAARLTLAALVFFFSVTSPGWAGPPYITDDPEPTRTGRWENYVFLAGTSTPGGTAGQAGLEFNYGGAPNLQLTLTLPEDYVSSHRTRAALGDLTMAAKYRFLRPPDGSWLPDAAIFPALTLPSGSRRFDTGHASLFVPLWLEKDFGKWSTFGGGGYDVNPGSGQKNYSLLGWAVTRSFGEHLDLGVEIYHQAPSSAGETAQTNLGVGAIYQVTKHWALMASGGPGLVKPLRSSATAFYVSLQFTN